MDRFDDDTLIAELRELRPTPRPGFAAELDRRAAAGFPRGADTTASAFAPIVHWWRGMSPRRRLMPVLTVGLAAIVVATGVVAVTQSGTTNLNMSRSGEGNFLSQTETFGTEEGGGSAESSAGTEIGGPGTAAPAAKAPSAANGGAGAGAGAESAEKSAAQAEGEERVHEVEPFTTEAAPVQGRDIERSAYIVLGTKPGEVSGAAAKVYEAVHAANGVVLHSSVQSGNAGATGASFDLLIPSAKLNDALAAFSSIAEVRERHDATNDITAPTVSATEELADSNAAIEGLLKELADTETEAERESVEARLREERRQHAAIRASLDHLHKRASMSEVSLRIVTNHGAGVTPPSKDNGNWGVGDALHAAGQILTIAAGVVLIGLAVLAPFALIGLVIWAGNRFRIRRLRERTLG